MKLKQPNQLSRREAIKGLTALGLSLVATACAPQTDPRVAALETENALLKSQMAALQAGQPQRINPARAEGKGNEDTLMRKQEISAPTTPDLTQSLEQQGIRVELPNPNWPKSYEEVAEVLNRPGSSNILTADKVTAIVETTDNGRVWRGWYMAEPPFPLKPGITYNEQLGYHVDANSQPIFDPQQIFEADWNNLPADLRENFANHLVSLRLNRPDVAVFARTGGVSNNGDPANTHYFFGTEGVEVDSIEQLSLIPTAEICPTDLALSAVTRSFRQAALEFRDNPDARAGKISVRWFNPETNQFQTLDGRMIAKLTEFGYDLTVLEKLPASIPLSAEEMAKRFGGQADKWVVNPATWEWFYEAFALQSGVRYLESVGHVDQNGNILVRNNDEDLRKIFNFKVLDRKALIQDLNAPGSLPAALFARAGMAPNDPELNNHSWYTWDLGNLRLSKPAIEQATLMIVNLGSCPTTDYGAVVMNRVITLAEDQPDQKVIALYWDGYQFVPVTK